MMAEGLECRNRKGGVVGEFTCGRAKAGASDMEVSHV